MVSKQMMSWGAIVVGILIAATEYMALPAYLNYLWALLVLAWGVMEMQK